MPLLSGLTSGVGNMHTVETIKESRGATANLGELLSDRRAFSRLIREEGKAIIEGRTPAEGESGKDRLRGKATGSHKGQARKAKSVGWSAGCWAARQNSII